MKTNTIGIISANYVGGDFGDLTQRRTAATIPFGGRYRLIDFALSNMVNSGISTVGLITPYYHRSIMDHVGAGKPWGLAKKTGGLFVLPGTIYGRREDQGRFLFKDFIRNRRIFDRSTEEYVLITDSSTICNMDYRPVVEAHESSGADITLVYKKEAGRKEGIYLDCLKSGRVKAIHGYTEKSEKLFINTFVVSRQFMKDLIISYDALDNYELIDLFIQEAGQFRINAYEYTGYAGIINNISDYMNVSTGLLNKDISAAIFGSERQIYTKVQDEPPTIYKENSSVKNSLVSAGCIIEGTVENSIIFRHTVIKSGAVVKNSIIMQGSTVGADARVDKVVCDKYVNIPENAVFTGGKNGPVIFGKHNNL